MKNTLKYTLAAILLAAAPLASADVIDCVKLSNTVKAAVSADSNNVLNIVAMHIAANESCACEIVKAAIIASHASKEVVAQIVDVAINEAPSMLRIITQCAIAIAPDAQPNIQMILEMYDFAGGEGYSEKGGLEKGGVPKPEAVVDNGNPLDRTLIEGFPPLFPPCITPPTITPTGSSCTILSVKP